MAQNQMNIQVEIPKTEQAKPVKQASSQNLPLTIILQQAKLQMIKATTDTMREYGIPATMMDGIVAGILADIRAQASADLITDFHNQIMSQDKKAGDKID